MPLVWKLWPVAPSRGSGRGTWPGEPGELSGAAAGSPSAAGGGAGLSSRLTACCGNGCPGPALETVLRTRGERQFPSSWLS